MKTKLSLRLFACLLLLVFSGLTIATAEDAAPCADSDFLSATINFNASKTATFSADTVLPMKKIYVQSVWIERLNEDGEWTYHRSLTAPSGSATNTTSLYLSHSYIGAIGPGTYRLWATFNADGHTTHRCSNRVTFY